MEFTHAKRSQVKAVNRDERDKGDKKNSGIKAFLRVLCGKTIVLDFGLWALDFFLSKPL